MMTGITSRVATLAGALMLLLLCAVGTGADG